MPSVLSSSADKRLRKNNTRVGGASKLEVPKEARAGASLGEAPGEDHSHIDFGSIAFGRHIDGNIGDCARRRADTFTLQLPSTVAEALRTLPQNFGGGQNPGVGFNVPATSGEDIGGGSSVNLRGLGSDATLTLLDGRRVSYNAAHQSVDISAIPFNAIARIDVVPDGSSALFGSDAVAGVVNVILRRDLNGFEMSARVGGSTDGGNFEQQYSATGGRTWAGGGLLLAYEYGSNSRITDDQRSYGASRPGLTIYVPSYVSMLAA